jgi:hypothetical protein
VDKATWEQAPWNVYHEYSLALGHFTNGEVVLVVSQGARCCDPDVMGGRPYSIVTTDAFSRRFYDEP